MPHASFHEDRAVSHQLIRGITTSITAIPAVGVATAHADTTPFLEGLNAGIKATGGMLLDHTNTPIT